MTRTRFLLYCCIAAHALALISGLSLSEIPLLAAAGILVLPAWLLWYRKHHDACLVMSTVLGAAALLFRAPLLLILVSSCCSLASRELTRMEQALAHNEAGTETSRYRLTRIRVLTAALCAGAAVPAAGRLLNFSVPFFLFALLIVLAVVCFDRLARLFSRTGRPDES